MVFPYPVTVKRTNSKLFLLSVKAHDSLFANFLFSLILLVHLVSVLQSLIALSVLSWHFLIYWTVLGKKTGREEAKGINTLTSLSSLLLITCSAFPLAKSKESQKGHIEGVGYNTEIHLKDLVGVSIPSGCRCFW